MEQRIKKMQFAYLHKLSQMKETRWTKQCLVAQVNYYRDKMLIPEILRSLNEYNLPTKLEDIELIHKNQWKQMIINSTKQRANNQYKKATEDMKKMENLKNYKDSIKRELYLDQTSNKEAQTIFKIRCRMLNLRANFKGTNEITTCPRCNIEEDGNRSTRSKTNSLPPTRSLMTISLHQLTPPYHLAPPTRFIS